MPKKTTHQEGGDIKKDFARLNEIADWFENRTEADVEEGLAKAKEASEIVLRLKERLDSIENEFEEIKKKLD